MNPGSPRREEEQYVARLVLVVDEAGTIRDVRESMGEIKLVRTLEADAPLFDLVHADDIEPLLMNRDWCGRHPGKSISLRVRLSRGAEWWTHVIVTLVAAGDGFTELRLERDDAAASRSAERQMRQAVDYSQDGIIVSSPTRCLYVNTACARLQGYDSVEELIASGRTRLSDGVHPDDLPMVMEEVRQRIAGIKKVSQYELRLMRRDGSFVWVEARAALVRWSGEWASLSWFSDISHRKHVESELIEHRDAAERANRSKSQFLANMSHELRTPLNAIIGFSQMIGGQMFGPVDAKYVDYAADIQNSGMHLLDLINEILDLSKLDAGKHELQEGEVDLTGLARDCLGIMRPAALTGRLLLADEIKAGLPKLRADGRALKQVLLNFLSNAVKFTPEGGTVTLRLARAGDDIEFGVRDTGIGMSKADVDVAMEPFGQVRNNPLVSREHKGTGLGLPISLQLIRLHGGDIRIESVPGQGTTITARLPAARILAAAA